MTETKPALTIDFNAARGVWRLLSFPSQRLIDGAETYDEIDRIVRIYFGLPVADHTAARDDRHGDYWEDAAKEAEHRAGELSRDLAAAVAALREIGGNRVQEMADGSLICVTCMMRTYPEKDGAAQHDRGCPVEVTERFFAAHPAYGETTG